MKRTTIVAQQRKHQRFYTEDARANSVSVTGLWEGGATLRYQHETAVDTVNPCLKTLKANAASECQDIDVNSSQWTII